MQSSELSVDRRKSVYSNWDYFFFFALRMFLFIYSHKLETTIFRSIIEINQQIGVFFSFVWFSFDRHKHFRAQTTHVVFLNALLHRWLRHHMNSMWMMMNFRRLKMVGAVVVAYCSSVLNCLALMIEHDARMLIQSNVVVVAYTVVTSHTIEFDEWSPRLQWLWS